jgi:hypothetical protein
MNIIGVFNTEESLVEAIKKVKEKGVKVNEVYTPYPIHEVLTLLGRKSKMTIAAWLYGLFGAIAVLAFLIYTSVIDWPLNYGGKPFNSFPSFIVITIVLTIFIVTIMSLFTFSWRAKIYPGKIPAIIDERITDDKFLLVLSSEENDKETDLPSLLKEVGATEVNEKK